MPLIFVNTNNSDPSSKLYNAMKTGKSARAAEEKMQKMVKKIIDKDPGFTTTKADDSKGYSIRLNVSNVQVLAGNTKCSLSGSIVRYPPTVNAKGDKGEEMVSTSMTGSATASGTSEASLFDGIEAITEKLTKDSIVVMKNDAQKRSATD